MLVDLELGLLDAGGLDSGAEDVLVVGEEVGAGEAGALFKVVSGAVVELDLVGAGDDGLDGGVLPEGLDGVGDVRVELLGLAEPFEDVSADQGSGVLFGLRQLQFDLELVGAVTV